MVPVNALPNKDKGSKVVNEANDEGMAPTI